MCSPSPPPPPDYAGAAAAQGAANVEAAQAQSRLNNPNVVNPYGTQTFTEGAGPSDRPTVVQTLSPDQQALYDKSVATKLQLGDLSTQGADALQGIVGKKLDVGSLPAAPGDATQTRNSVINAMMSRVNEDTANSKDQKNSDLVAAGLHPGDKGYNDQIALIDRGYNDARNTAITSAGAEAQRDFNMDTQARKDALAEAITQREMPLNEVTALMSGSQVSNPFAVPGVSQNSSVAPAPVMDAMTQQGQYGTDVYNQQVSSSNSTKAAGGALAGAAMMAMFF